MSGIIKSASAEQTAAISPTGGVSRAPVVAIAKYDEERSGLVQSIFELERKLTAQHAEIDGLRMDVVRAREDGISEGYESGLEAAQDRQSERLVLLEDAIRRAHADMVEGLSSLPRLSALLARDCVEIVLGNASDRIEYIGRIIDSQASRIEAAMLVEVNVSRLDFPDDIAIAALVNRAGITKLNVTAVDGAPSGHCVMVMRLGRIGVGINQQWSVLRDILSEMAQPDSAK